MEALQDVLLMVFFVFGFVVVCKFEFVDAAVLVLDLLLFPFDFIVLICL